MNLPFKISFTKNKVFTTPAGRKYYEGQLWRYSGPSHIEEDFEDGVVYIVAWCMQDRVSMARADGKCMPHYLNSNNSLWDDDHLDAEGFRPLGIFESKKNKRKISK